MKQQEERNPLIRKNTGNRASEKAALVGPQGMACRHALLGEPGAPSPELSRVSHCHRVENSIAPTANVGKSPPFRTALPPAATALGKLDTTASPVPLLPTGVLTLPPPPAVTAHSHLHLRQDCPPRPLPSPLPFPAQTPPFLSSWGSQSPFNTPPFNPHPQYWSSRAGVFTAHLSLAGAVTSSLSPGL